MRLKSLRPLSAVIFLHALVLVLAIGLLMGKKWHPAAGKEKIVVISIDGVISIGQGMGRNMDVDAIVQSLSDLKDKDDVKAVVLRINSPGGSVGAVQEIYRAVMKLKSKGKVVVSSFGDVAASGGYYVACASDRIVSNPGTLTGSIGVIMELPNIKGLLAKVGVNMQTIKSGAMKDAGSPFRDMTESEKEYFNTVIQDAYDQFFQTVKTGRKIDEKTLQPLADGRIFSGRMAMQNKLVDELGGLDEAIDAAKKLTGLADKHPEIVVQKDKMSLEKILSLVSRSPVQDLTELRSDEARLLYRMR